jgi:hypothetical protein
LRKISTQTKNKKIVNCKNEGFGKKAIGIRKQFEFIQRIKHGKIGKIGICRHRKQ